MRMTATEQAEQRLAEIAVAQAVEKLELLGSDSEDIQVAIARLRNWLTENEGRWVR